MKVVSVCVGKRRARLLSWLIIYCADTDTSTPSSSAMTCNQASQPHHIKSNSHAAKH
jgi:hypothetical protein